MKMEFVSAKQFKKYFFSKSYEKEMIEKMNSEELGKYYADKSLDNFRQSLRDNRSINRETTSFLVPESICKEFVGCKEIMKKVFNAN